MRQYFANSFGFAGDRVEGREGAPLPSASWAENTIITEQRKQVAIANLRLLSSLCVSFSKISLKSYLERLLFLPELFFSNVEFLGRHITSQSEHMISTVFHFKNDGSCFSFLVVVHFVPSLHMYDEIATQSSRWFAC